MKQNQLPKPLGLYVHIPYCTARCRYCNFVTRGGARSVPERYVDALLREMSARLPRRPASVYFGGGTPGLLTPEQVQRLIQAARPLPGAEVTLEANPDGVSAALLAGFREAGVTRISFGVQTASNESLQRLGRLHTAGEARRALRLAREAGFRDVCGDVMLALPHYSREEMRATLDLLIEGGCTHISAYLLKIEPNTAFGKRPPEGLPGPDEAAESYLACAAALEAAGYRQYEISNFCLPGHEGQHNLGYWNCRDYLGLGPGAHSCLEDERFYWPSDTEGFLQGNKPISDGPCTAVDYLLMRTRLVQGLDTALWKERYGGSFTARQKAFLKQCAQHGLARWDGCILALTPQGFLVQNSILEELL